MATITIRLKGKKGERVITNAKGRGYAGDTLTGKAKNLQPLVDSGAAELVEDTPKKAKRKPAKRTKKPAPEA